MTVLPFNFFALNVFTILLIFCHSFTSISTIKNGSTTRRRMTLEENSVVTNRVEEDIRGWISLNEKMRNHMEELGKRSRKDKGLYIVEQGVETLAMTDAVSPHMKPFLKEVRGCTAKVSISVKLIRRHGDDVVEMWGFSDSRLIRGILAILIDCCSFQTAESLLRLNPIQLADIIGTEVDLKSSRVIGIGNIIRHIQEQIREQLNGTSFATAKRIELPEKRPHFSNASTNSQHEVAVLLSGGVDSSVALRLLLEQGYHVRPFYLKIWLEDELSHLGECPWEEDMAYAQAVCEQVDLPLEAISLQKEYWDLVVGYTLQEARAGRTPNPDIMCNSRIKFGMFYDYVGRHFQHIATGHYAVVTHEKGVSRLYLSADSFKDQTYFLCNLTQFQLQRCLFPIGHLTKQQVRKEAERFNLPTKFRPDSQGICFLGKLKFDCFLQLHLGVSPGKCIELNTGNVVGEHRGLWYHTIGQRKGLGQVLDSKVIHRGPWFVASKDVESNTLIVTTLYGDVQTERMQFRFKDFHVICYASSVSAFQRGEEIELFVKTRHGPAMQKCLVTLEQADESVIEGSEGFCKLLEQKDSGLAPGQFAVFYDSNECVASAVIA